MLVKVATGYDEIMSQFHLLVIESIHTMSFFACEIFLYKKLHSIAQKQFV